MPRMRPRVAKREEVSLTRQPTGAIIAFHDGKVGPTHLQLGEALGEMTDEEILEAFNSTMRAMQVEVREPDDE